MTNQTKLDWIKFKTRMKIKTERNRFIFGAISGILASLYIVSYSYYLLFPLLKHVERYSHTNHFDPILYIASIIGGISLLFICRWIFDLMNVLGVILKIYGKPKPTLPKGFKK